MESYNCVRGLAPEDNINGLSLSFLIENQAAATEKLHSHHNTNALSARNQLSKERSHEMEANSSSGKGKAVGRKEGNHGGSSRRKELELSGCSPKREAIPEVEALLARLRAL